MFEPILAFIALGGPVVAILAVVSVFTLALMVMKVTQFLRQRVNWHRDAERAVHLWVHGSHASARQIAEADHSAVGVCLVQTMRMASDPRYSRDQIEEEVSRVAVIRLHALQRGFKALDAIAQIAPLLGLFGTVLGMIEAFQKLQSAGSSVDPSLLAGGIWVALLTTAAGLAIAMPVSLVLTWLETRVENERVAIETLTGAVLSPVMQAPAATVEDAHRTFAAQQTTPAHAH